MLFLYGSPCACADPAEQSALWGRILSTDREISISVCVYGITTAEITLVGKSVPARTFL